MSYKTVIVDDEPLAIEVLKHYFIKESDFVIVSTFTNPVEALHFLNRVHVDVLFLDINMAVLHGLVLLQQLKKVPLLVFTTAHKVYLQDGFDYGILDYLQKPIKPGRFQVTLDRIRKQVAANNKKEKRIHLKSAQKEIIIDSAEILFLQALRDYCLVYLQNGTKVMAVGSLKHFIERHELEPTFVRVHKSYAIPILMAREILSGGIIQIGSHRIPIGRKYKERVAAVFK